MNIEIREDSVIITGYVNAVERLSRPITEKLRGKVRTFLERIKSGVFRNALKKNDNVLVLLNHDKKRVLATTKDNTAKLAEDSIGLRAEVTIYDKEVIEKARNGELVGWSFGFYPNADELGSDGTNEIRTVTDLDLDEVSILDNTKTPAYYGTSIEARSTDVAYSIRESNILEINEDAKNKHKEIEEKSEEEHKQVETETEDKKMEILAEKIATKVAEKLNGAGEEKTIPEEPVEEESDENRAIDYSSFESRINKLKKA